MTVIERFLKLVSFDTTSSEESGQYPSTPNQKVLGAELVRQMQELGIQDARMDAFGYVYGTIPANCEKNLPVYGLIAHMDTAPDASGENVNPILHENYDGGDVVLPATGKVMKVSAFPFLASMKGETLITTDGTTLLGADDKAGVAEIMTAVETVIREGRPHGKLCIGFTPDEEIGEGVDHFDLKKFGAKFAYTLDGGEIGELEYENFNAALARLTFKGRNFHPGYAKNKMVNSIKVANEFMASLPKKEAPEYTSGYEGFFHIYSIKGTVEETVLEILIRDFDRETFEWRKGVIENGVREFTRKYDLPVLLDMKDQYANMKERLEPVRYIVDIAKQAMVELGIKPLFVPIRGGTNGSKLSFMGLPTPNLSNGAHNSHGRYEYIPVSSMENAVKLIVKISEFCAKV